jgi:hypothetical protein
MLEMESLSWEREGGERERERERGVGAIFDDF